MNIALLGAGHIGQTIAGWLAGSGDYAVTVMDRRDDALARVAAATPGLRTQRLDSADGEALAAALPGHDAVVNALPYHLAGPAARAAHATGCHYFDLTEDVAATREIRRLAEGAATAFMPQCGLAPGFVGIVAHHLAQGFDELHEVKMRVGALPVFPTNALKYNLTWSVDGLVNEYIHPCEAIRDGQRTEVLPLEGLEHFSLDGTEYEAFNTSGGLGTLCETLAGHVRTLDYKSVRYPGHLAVMRMLMEDLRLRDDPELLKALLRRAVPATMQDVVLVFVTASGMRGGSLVQEVFARKIFASTTPPAPGEADPARSGTGAPCSAIQLTTAAGVCVALDLFRQGALPRRGFVRQEQIALPAFLANRFAAPYRQSRSNTAAMP